MATVTEMIGEGAAGVEGRVLRREIVVNRMIEGEMTLSMKRAVLLATSVAANMFVSIVTGLPSKCDEKEREREEKKRK